MHKQEQAIRDAALALHDAIAEGNAVGLNTQLPSRFEQLPGIAVSETKKAQKQPIPVTPGHEPSATALDGNASGEEPSKRKKS